MVTATILIVVTTYVLTMRSHTREKVRPIFKVFFSFHYYYKLPNALVCCSNGMNCEKIEPVLADERNTQQQQPNRSADNEDQTRKNGGGSKRRSTKKRARTRDDRCLAWPACCPNAKREKLIGELSIRGSRGSASTKILFNGQKKNVPKTGEKRRSMIIIIRNDKA